MCLSLVIAMQSLDVALQVSHIYEYIMNYFRARDAFLLPLSVWLLEKVVMCSLGSNFGPLNMRPSLKL